MPNSILRTVTALTVVGAVLASAGGVASGGPAAPRQAAKTVITVTARDFRFTFSRTSVKHGTTVVFHLVNKGAVGHNLKLGGKVTKLIEHAKTANLTLKFTKAGTYTYLCTVPGHAASGMKGKLKVT